MDFKTYLTRIGIAGVSLPPTLETLCFVQQQHVRHIPFENIDIINRTPIPLSADAFFEKLIIRKRGGYCYECNGLFYKLLSALGFEVTMISCRVAQRGKIGQPYDHLSLIVRIAHQDWLVDAGFGDFSQAPLLLTEAPLPNTYQDDFATGFYGNLSGTAYRCAAKWSSAKMKYVPVYLFTMAPQNLSAFSGMNYFHQTSPESHFTKTLICSMPHEQGRTTLINNRLIMATSGGKEEKLLYGNLAIEAALEKYFGIANTSLVFAL